MKIFKRVLIGVFVTIIVLVGTVVALLSTESVRQYLYAEGVKALSEKLQTRIKVDKITVHFRRGGVALYGFEMEDRQHVTMLSVDTLEAGLELWPLLRREVNIDGIYLHGVKAVLYKEHPDTAANYQFVIDAFKSKKKKKQSKTLDLNCNLNIFDVSRADFSWDVKSKPEKGVGKIDANHLKIQNFAIRVSGDIMGKTRDALKINNLVAYETNAKADLGLKYLELRYLTKHNTVAEMRNLKFSLPGKKAAVDTLIVQKPGELQDFSKNIDITLRGFNYWCNNGKPRKNKIKPHRGAFDPGHLNSIVNANISIHELRKDTMTLTINSMDLFDRDSGLDIRSCTADVEKYGDDIYVKNTRIAIRKTRLKMATAHLRLTRTNVAEQHKSNGKTFTKTKSKITGLTISPVLVTSDVVLKEISKPFAPVLSNFTTPLKLRVTCCGNLDRILFKNILVTGLNKAIIVKAQGDLCDATKKKALCLHFWDISMLSRGKATGKLVGHFAKKVNLKMQRQMNMIGDIRYKGGFGVFYKRVTFHGTLYSKFGDVTFEFTLNGFVKRMIGTMDTSSFELGELMNISKLGPLSAHANFNFVTKRPKHVNKKAKGKLPQGTLNARIDGVKYGLLSFRHITVDLESNGKTAKGTLVVQQKVRDIVVDVQYHQTVDDQSYNYKVRLRKISAEDKAARKAQRKAEKAAAKAEKAAAKAADSDEDDEKETSSKPKKKKRFLGIF